MNPEIKAKWVTALRSGNYRQRNLRLKGLANGPEFCCMGVLCDILTQEKIVKEVGIGIYKFQDEVMTHALEPKLLAYVMLSEDDQSSLVTKNDVEKLPFVEIANWIEEHL